MVSGVSNNVQGPWRNSSVWTASLNNLQIHCEVELPVGNIQRGGQASCDSFQCLTMITLNEA